MKIGHRPGLLTMLLALSSIANAQIETPATVVMRTDAVVEGVFRGATAEEILLDVAGQSLRLPLARIKYISFAGRLERVTVSKEPAPPRLIDQAQAAFKELRAATEAGLLREQYSQKLLDTLPRINEFVNGPGTDWADVRLAMQMATRLYKEVLGGVGSTSEVLQAWQQAPNNWAQAAKVVDYATLLASDPREETHVAAPSEAAIKLGQSVQGRLGVGDVLMSSTLDVSSAGSFNDVFKLELGGQANLKIQMNGNGVCRPHLTLADARGKKIEGDMGGSTYPATITRKLVSGTYFIWAGTDSPNEVCAYSLDVGAKN